MQPILHCLHLAQGVCKANIRPQAGDHTAEVIIMMAQNLRRQSRRVWNPHLYLRIGIGEPFRKHADHCVWLPVQTDLTADNRWIAAEPPREEIPRKHDGTSIWTIFAFGKRASDGRIHPQERKQVPGPAPGAHQFRQISMFSRQGELPKAPSGYVFKAVRLRAPIVVVCRSN